MLIRFVTANFLSFNEEEEFNMIAGSSRSHKHHVYKTKKLNILKGAAIYGANAAGKSNLVKAISFFKTLVEKGKLDSSVNSKKFKLNTENQNKSVEFEIEFSYKNTIYAYGLRIDGNIIEKEYLYISGIDAEDKLIFERKTDKGGKIHIKTAPKYQKTAKDKLLIELMEENLLKSDELFLGKYESLKIKDIDEVREWIVDDLVIMYPHSKSEQGFIFFIGLLQELAVLTNGKITDKLTTFTNELLASFDTGVKKLGINTSDFNEFFAQKDSKIKEKVQKDLENSFITYFLIKDDFFLALKNDDAISIVKVVAIHKDENDEDIGFELSEESDGTRRLLDFIPVFYAVLESGKTVIIDEIDQSLHPSLLQTLVKKIMSDETTKGQLIFTTHEANLLDLNIFRQDEVWFAEKNKKGETKLYALSDFKQRSDLDIRKGYLKGRFGAIPFTANLKKLNWHKDA